MWCEGDANGRTEPLEILEVSTHDPRRWGGWRERRKTERWSSLGEGLEGERELRREWNVSWGEGEVGWGRGRE